MRRGEIRVLHSRVAERLDRPSLIISADSLNEADEAGYVMTAPIDTSGAAPDLIVTVRIVQPIEGVIRLDNVTSARKDRVGKLIGRVDPDTMDHVNIALRAALDL